MCAVVVDGVLVSDKERKKLAKQKASPKKRGEKSWVGKEVWFLEDLRLFIGTVTEDRDDGFYMIEAQDQRTDLTYPYQMCIMPKEVVKLNQ